MTTSPDRDRSHESVINAALSGLLLRQLRRRCITASGPNSWCACLKVRSSFRLRASPTAPSRPTRLRGCRRVFHTLDVRKLGAWQLDEAQSVWRNVRNREFEPFHRCAADPARIELDRRVVQDVLGIGEDAVAAVAKLRALLATDSSVRGSKKAELPGWGDTIVVPHSRTW